MSVNTNRQAISAAAVNPRFVPPIPRLTNPQDQASLQAWANQFTQGLTQAMTALKLDRVPSGSSDGSGTTNSPVSTFTGQQYAANGGFFRAVLVAPFPFVNTPFTIAVCIRTKTGTGVTDTQRPNRDVLLTHPTSDDGEVYVRFAIPPLPLEEFQIEFFTRVISHP